jgi:hypothetical protein
VFMMLQALLGIHIDAWNACVHIDRPELPGEVDHLAVRGLVIGASCVDLVFQRAGGTRGRVARIGAWRFGARRRAYLATSDAGSDFSYITSAVSPLRRARVRARQSAGSQRHWRDPMSNRTRWILAAAIATAVSAPAFAGDGDGMQSTERDQTVIDRNPVVSPTPLTEPDRRHTGSHPGARLRYAGGHEPLICRRARPASGRVIRTPNRRRRGRARTSSRATWDPNSAKSQ